MSDPRTGTSPQGSLPSLVLPKWAGLGESGSRLVRPPVRVAEAKAAPMPKAAPAPKPEAVKELLARIASGKASLHIDLGHFKVGPALAGTDFEKETVAKGAEVQKLYLAHLEDLAKTPAGFQLLSHLAQSKHKTTIEFNYKDLSNSVKSDGKNHTNKVGEPATVRINPSLTKYHERVVEPWMSDRQRYSFYHELVHAWHVTSGTQTTGTGPDGVPNSETQAVGVGAYAKEPVSENVIRQQLGAPPRPHYKPKSS